VIESFKTVSPETEAKMRPLMSAAAELVRNSVFEATETLRQEVARLQSDQDELIHSLNGCENRIAEADSTIAALRNEITVLNAKQEATEKTLTESKMEVIAERKDKEEFRQKLEFLKFREQDWIESKAELAKIKEQMVLEVSEAKEKAAWYKGRLDELVKDPKKDDPQSVPPTTSTTSKP
jgi:chromosome segregation ATPase